MNIGKHKKCWPRLEKIYYKNIILNKDDYFTLKKGEPKMNTTFMAMMNLYKPCGTGQSEISFKNNILP